MASDQRWVRWVKTSEQAKEERKHSNVKKRPDMLLVLTAVFGLGVAMTVLMPFSSGDTVAAPASPLQAGIVETR